MGLDRLSSNHHCPPKLSFECFKSIVLKHERKWGWSRVSLAAREAVCWTKSRCSHVTCNPTLSEGHSRDKSAKTKATGHGETALELLAPLGPPLGWRSRGQRCSHWRAGSHAAHCRPQRQSPWNARPEPRPLREPFLGLATTRPALLPGPGPGPSGVEAETQSWHCGCGKAQVELSRST